jgi:predicted AlkP superfamily phosphohydrolase/phosphomutase
VLVIGLDGATLDLIEPWATEGHLPNLASLMSNGCCGRLASTIQPTTAPAWATFMTGVNQGKHGLYDFVRRRPGGYQLEVTNASQIAAPTLFDIASQLGLYVVAINVPYTFPPHPVNGVMIGGPFAPALSRDLVFPPAYFDVLKTVAPGYFVLPDYDPHAADPLAAYANKLLQEVEMRERLSLHLLKTEPWDLFTVVFMATDEAQHAYWHCQNAPEDSSAARYRHVIRDVYRRIDQAIGAILAQIAAECRSRDTIVIIMSDHGAGPLRWMINLNRWLSEAGYLQFRTDGTSQLRQLWAAGVKKLAYAYCRYVPGRMRTAVRTWLGARRFDQVKGEVESVLLTSNVEWDRTRTYALGAGGNIFINLRGREPAGTVQPGIEYERVRQEVADALATLSDPETGRPIVRRVYRREELYDGPFLSQAPDLVIQWEDYTCWGRGRYDSRGTPIFEASSHFEFRDLPLTGAHRPEGVLIISGPGIRSGARIEGARLLDLAPTILSLLSIKPPSEMDGRLLHELLLEDEVEHVQAAAEFVVKAPDRQFDYSAEEAEEISQRLRSLGYL